MGTSIALHVAVAAIGLIPGLWPSIDLPEFEYELTHVELLDPDAIQGDDGPGEMEPPPIIAPPPPPPVEAPPPEPEEKGIEEKPKPAEKKEGPTDPDGVESEAEVRRTLGSKRTPVDRLGPANSTFHFFLVPKKVRRMKHAQSAMDIMASFPDFEYLVDDGGFDPLRDFDHLVISTPNITDPRETFLVVDYTMERDQVRRTIERASAARGESITWVEENGILRGNPVPIDPQKPDWDPRWFVLPEHKIAAYIREEFVPALLKEEVGEEKTASNYVANLAQLEKFARRIPSAGFHVLLKDLRASVRMTSQFPIPLPDAIEVTMEAVAEPEAMIRATFLTEVDAKEAEIWFTQTLAELIDSSMVLRLQAKWIYELFEIEREGAELRLWGRFDAAQIQLLLELAADTVAKVQRKDPEEIAASRKKRLENWEKRKEGKLPPTALDEAPPEPPPAKPQEPAAEPLERAPLPQKRPTPG